MHKHLLQSATAKARDLRRCNLRTITSSIASKLYGVRMPILHESVVAQGLTVQMFISCMMIHLQLYGDVHVEFKYSSIIAVHALYFYVCH